MNLIFFSTIILTYPVLLNTQTEKDIKAKGEYKQSI